jgi:hypothetical protein
MIAHEAMQRQQEAAERAQNAKEAAYRRTLVNQDAMRGLAHEASTGIRQRQGGIVLGFDEQGRAYLRSTNERLRDEQGRDKIAIIPDYATREAGITPDMIGKEIGVDVAPNAIARREYVDKSPSKITYIRDSHDIEQAPKPSNGRGFEL